MEYPDRLWYYKFISNEGVSRPGVHEAERSSLQDHEVILMYFMAGYEEYSRLLRYNLNEK